MTTIVYRAGILAADSLVVDRGTIIAETVKVRKAGDYVVAICGMLWQIEAFAAWIAAGSPPDDKPQFNKKNGFEGIAVDTNLVVLHYGPSLNVERDMIADFFALGSGMDIALGAMAMGASAVEALKIACRFDQYTGGPIWYADVAKQAFHKVELGSG